MAMSSINLTFSLLDLAVPGKAPTDLLQQLPLLYSRRSNLSLVEVNQRKAVNTVFLNCGRVSNNFTKKEKQPNSKSITVLKRRLIQYVKKLALLDCDPPTICQASLNCKLVKFKSFILKIQFLQTLAFLFVQTGLEINSD